MRDKNGRFQKGNKGFWLDKKRPNMLNNKYREGISGWSKGLTKETDVRLKKLSESNIGKKLSEETKNKLRQSMKEQYKSGKRKITIPKLSGKQHGMYGKTHTPEVRKKLSESLTGRKLTKEHKINIGLGQEGEKGSNWQGGKSFEPYSPKFNNTLKEQIRRRDHYRCQECFRHQSELRTKTNKLRKLSIHHIDYDKKNNNPNNLISLCITCHAQTNFNRDNWVDYYKNIMEDNYGI